MLISLFMLPQRASNHGISLDEIPPDRRQKFLDRQKNMGNWGTEQRHFTQFCRIWFISLFGRFQFSS